MLGVWVCCWGPRWTAGNGCSVWCLLLQGDGAGGDRPHPPEHGLACGNLVLTVAVLSILITAPLGAFAIDLLYQRLLQQQTGGGDT